MAISANCDCGNFGVLSRYNAVADAFGAEKSTAIIALHPRFDIEMGSYCNSGSGMMKTLTIAGALIIGTATAVVAQDAPKFLTETYPEHALQSALQARGVLEGEQAALDPKTRELIALGVAAQIPCSYCVYAHTKKARAQGASEAEIREAVATAATTRQWSTVLNGMQYDLDEFKAEYDQLTGATN